MNSLTKLRAIIKESIKVMKLEDTIQDDVFMIWHKPMLFEIHVGDTVAYRDKYGEYNNTGKVTEKENGFVTVNNTDYFPGDVRIKKSI